VTNVKGDKSKVNQEDSSEIKNEPLNNDDLVKVVKLETFVEELNFIVESISNRRH